MNEFNSSLILIGAPGILCYFLSHKLISRIKRTWFEIILLIFIYSLFSYILVDIAYIFLNAYFSVSYNAGDALRSLLLDFNTGKPVVSFRFLPAAMIASAIFAFFLAWVVDRSYLNRFAGKIQITKRFGDTDVWHYFMNDPERAFFNSIDTNRVYVRDHEKDLCYDGSIISWSDGDHERREIILKFVTVYKNSDVTEPLYSVDAVYLQLKEGQFSIEIPND